MPSTAKLRFQQPAHQLLRLSVIVPAKDEAQYITATLDALRNQFDEAGVAVPYKIYEVLVLANNCTDDTLKICQHYQKQYPDFQLYVESITLLPEIAHIGTARRLLMDAAYCRLTKAAGPKGIIVSTDADSEVDSQWIHHICSEIDGGVDVVGGRILPRDTPILSRLHHLRDVTYRFLRSRLEAELDPCISNPWPRHFQCYGPSLAVTCEIYQRAGRLPAIPFLEDEEFRKALKRVDAKFRHAPKVRIHTSSRLQGRVEFGFSVQLQQWSGMSLNQEQQMVESLQSVIAGLLIKNELRKLWIAIAAGSQMTMAIRKLAFKIHFDADELRLLLTKSIYFESLCELIEIHLMKRPSNSLILQPVSVAIQEFRAYFSLNSNQASREKMGLKTAIAV